MTKSLIVIGLLLTGTSLVANDAGKWFIGIGTFNGSGTNTYTTSAGVISEESETDYDASSIPLSIGFVGSTNNRLKFSSVSIDADSDGEAETFSGFDIDYNFTFGTSNLLPYIGVGLGIYTYEDTAQYFVENEDLKGVSVNFNFGLLYGITENLEFEAAYQRKSIKWQDSTYNDGYTDIDVETEDVISGIYLGINLKF